MKDIKEQKEKLQLYMKTFGFFELTFQGKSLLKGKSKESQFVLLLQYLLHKRAEGSTREQLETILFDKRDIENKHNALQSVIYNAKKKLESIGIPKMKYMYLKDGAYYWNDEIEIIEDAYEFEKMFIEAVKAEGDDKLECYLKAVYLYLGEFLPDYSMNVWVTAENNRYQEMFDQCVKNCIELLEERKDYTKIIEVGKYAVNLRRYQGYERYVLEAYGKLGQHLEAEQYLKQMEMEYLNSIDIEPNEESIRYLDNLSDYLINPKLSLGEIQGSLIEFPESAAYICSYSVFKGIYHIIVRLSARANVSSYLILCSVKKKDGSNLSEKELGETEDLLRNALCNNIRKGDVITKYGPGQYLGIINELKKEHCSIVQERIENAYYAENKKYQLKFSFERIKSKNF